MLSATNHVEVPSRNFPSPTTQTHAALRLRPRPRTLRQIKNRTPDRHQEPERRQNLSIKSTFDL